MLFVEHPLRRRQLDRECAYPSHGVFIASKSAQHSKSLACSEGDKLAVVESKVERKGLARSAGEDIAATHPQLAADVRCDFAGLGVQEHINDGQACG